MHEPQAGVEHVVQCVFRRQRLFVRAAEEDAFGLLDVDAAEVRVPELVEGRGEAGEVAGGEGGVGGAGGGGEFVEDPAVGEGEGGCGAGGAGGGEAGAGDEVRAELAEDVFGGLEDFVAEAAVGVDEFDVEVDVPAWILLASSRARSVLCTNLPSCMTAN